MKYRVSSIMKKQFISSVIVLAMVEMANSISGVVDGLVTGRFLGSVEMAAHGIASPYNYIVGVIGGMLMVSCQTMCARSIGSGRQEEANHTFSLTIVLAIILSGLLSVLGILFAGPVSMLLGARGSSAELLPYVKSYLIGLFIGTPAFVLMTILAPMVQLDGDAKRANLASAAVAVVDIVGDLFFVCVMDLGMFGMGLGTSCSAIAALLILLSHFWKEKSMFHFQLGKEDWKRASVIIFNGLPKGVRRLCKTLSSVFINTMVLTIGATAAMTAMSVQNNLRALLNTPAVGIGGTVLLMAGIYVGEQDKDSLKKLLATALRWTIFGIGAISAVFFVTAPWIAAFYVPQDAEVQALTANAIRFFSISVVLMGLNGMSIDYLQAQGNRNAATVFNTISELVSPVICVFILGSLFGINGVWVAFPAAQLLTLTSFVLYALFRKKAAGSISDRLLFLPEGFGVSDEDSISITIASMEEVIGVSQKVGEFCKEHNLDDRRSYLSSLCIEEMAGNTVKHGFSADNKAHTIDLRVIVEKESLLLRIRDDCMRFNLKEKVESWELDPEHPEENMGIRIVLGLSKDVIYTNTMRMNNLLIWL